MGLLRHGSGAADVAEGLYDDREDDHRAARDRRCAGTLVVREPHPERSEHDLQQGDHCHLGGRDEPGADGQEREPDAHLADPERGEHQPVVVADRPEVCEREANRDDEHLRGARRRHHRDLPPVPCDDDHRGERGRHHQRQDDRRGPGLERSRRHQDDTGARKQQGQPRPSVDPLPQEEPGEQRRHHRRRGLHEQDVRDGRVVQREQEDARREAEEHGHREAPAAHLPERPDGSRALGREDEGEQRERCKCGAARDLRGRRRVELALGEPGGRPGHRGECDRELTLAGPSLLEPGTRHAGQSTTGTPDKDAVVSRWKPEGAGRPREPPRCSVGHRALGVAHLEQADLPQVDVREGVAEERVETLLVDLHVEDRAAAGGHRDRLDAGLEVRSCRR